jgi:hypothetical protein
MYSIISGWTKVVLGDLGSPGCRQAISASDCGAVLRRLRCVSPTTFTYKQKCGNGAKRGHHPPTVAMLIATLSSRPLAQAAPN